MNIIWAPIKGFEELYEISTSGQVRALEKTDKYGRKRTAKFLRAHKKKNGYLNVGLYKNGKSTYKLVHRIVAETFLENPNNLPCVNHKDENKTNNTINNLEWCDSKYNNNYGTAHLRQARTKGRKVAQYTISGDFVCDFYSVSEAARRTGFSTGAILISMNNNILTNGFMWKDVKEVKVYG